MEVNESHVWIIFAGRTDLGQTMAKRVEQIDLREPWDASKFVTGSIALTVRQRNSTFTVQT